MNRERDFQKLGSGTLVNKNTKDYSRARNRRQIAKEHSDALGEDGKLVKVLNEVEVLAKVPERTDRKIRNIQARFEELNARDVRRLDAIEEHIKKEAKSNAILKEKVEESLSKSNEILKKLNKLMEDK